MRLLHFTDSHLFADPEGCLKGVNTADTLARVFALAGERDPGADALLLTGDLSEDGSRESYERLVDGVEQLGVSAFALSGNHDNRSAMMRAFIRPGGSIRMDGDFVGAGWQVLMLDSVKNGEVGGALSKAELDRLDRLLSIRDGLHALVCLHHQPVRMGSKWIDAIGLENGDELLRVIRRYPHVRTVLWGHVHQEFDEERDGVRLLSSPSTCVQFEPGAKTFSLEKKAPGYRWLELFPDGRIKTGVRRIRKVPEFILDDADR